MLIEEIINKAEIELSEYFSNLQKIEFNNQKKVLNAFIDSQVGEYHLKGTTGYGHNDIGREKLEEVYSKVFNTEDSIVRPHFASGTHAISTALFGCLSCNEELLSITGKPYDTLEEVIGIRGKNQGSLKDWGVEYKEIPLKSGIVDIENIKKYINRKTKVAFIQRSRGYEWRNSINMKDLEEICNEIKRVKDDIIIIVDNCYGEFTEEKEPTDVGADITVGSLIKNPGGGIVPTGGYITGKKDLIHRCACRLYAPGIGKEGGSTLDFLRLAFQGLFISPHIVMQSLKGSILVSKVLQDLGYEVSPKYNEIRTDIIQSIKFNSSEKLKIFCKVIQESSPIDSYVSPIPDIVPGYEDNVIMAAGNFIEGSTIELSADAALREPFIGYLQGGLSYNHVKIALINYLKNIL
ncbi:MAG: hypothetical protein KatS3mg068_1260 [Candidatus Sericytochromatia bacterium]|nr:MAG: hypothetical protein KatS3mg068_1260 [Candidatus Sericytochromatia bacterium]